VKPHQPILLLLAVVALPAAAQNRIGTGEVEVLYRQQCASCHGQNLEGGLGGPLLGDNWDYIKDYEDMAAYIAAGNPEMGMPGFGGALSPPQIRSLVIYIKEKNALAEKAEDQRAEETNTFTSELADFRVEDVIDGLTIPWSIAFLPSGDILITEKAGQLLLFQNGRLSDPIEGIPEVWNHGQGGLLDLALHPQYAQNGWVYLSFSATEDGRKGMTRIVRGRIKDGQWIDEETIFEVPEPMHNPSGVHFGTRLVFQDGYLFFSIGDRGRQGQAQDLTLPNGKIHRIHDDGRVPEDNPFVEVEGAFASIWTYGNRNAQGLAFHPETGQLWESEHGPRGGDEINLIEPGRNYGWPVITYGMNYSGTPITDKTAAPGMEQPKLYWVPSIAVCGMDFYRGDAIPAWRHQLFAGGLASQELHRLQIEDGEIVADEIVLKGLGRIRHVLSGPDGHLYLVLNGPGKVVRLEPVK